MRPDSRTAGPARKLRLARATPADSAAIARLHHASHTISFRAFAPPAWTASRRLAAYETDWRRRLADADADCATWLALAAGELVGIAGVEPRRGAAADPTRRLATIRALHVHPLHRREGIGGALWRALAAFARGRGYAAARADTIEANAPARRFLESLGGRVVARAPTGVEGVPIVTYEFEFAGVAQ